MPKFKKSTGYSSPVMKKVNNTGSAPFKMKTSPKKMFGVVGRRSRSRVGPATQLQRLGGFGGGSMRVRTPNFPPPRTGVF
mgnify:CR=1 FL=1